VARAARADEGAHAGDAEAPRSAEPIRLDFIADFNPPRPPSGSPPVAAGAAWDAALGGLSGLYYSEAERLLYAVTDDPRRFPPRLYTFDVQLSERAFAVVPRSVVLLHERTPSSLLDGVDCEALASDGAQGLLIATEGNEDRPAQRETRILQLSKQGLVSGQRVAIPEALIPEQGAAPTRGARWNRSFEGIAVTPSARFLYAILEEALLQDGPEASFEQGADVRLLRWELGSSSPPVQYFYRSEPLSPKPPPGSGGQGNNGASDLVALDDGRLLVLERAYVTPAGGVGVNTIRVFEVEVPQAAPAGDPLPRVSKRLVLDLNEIVPRLQPGLRTLDNFEGMTLGPRLPSGARSLLLVSDDNFSERQRTVFLAFALRGAG